MPSLNFIALVACIFLVAGWVKGIVGMGLPTVAMGALGLVMQPVQAATLLVVPALVTNIWQFSAGPAVRHVARRLAIMLLFVGIGTAVGIQFLTSNASHWPSVALGSILAIYGVLGLMLPRLAVPRHREAALSPAVGFVTGVLTGATGVFAVPAVPYLSALGLNREELVQALGLSFAVSTIALGIGLGASGSYSRTVILESAAAVIPALAGMYAGQAVRHRIDAQLFRRCFFGAMILVGAYMVIRALMPGW